MAVSTHQLNSIIDDIHVSLRYYAQTGCHGFECSKNSLAIIDGWSKNARMDSESLMMIRSKIGNCQGCKLWKGRKNIVFGAGDPNARLVFVGEGPGFKEDLQGEPFVGLAGQLLTKIIGAMQFSRKSVYICNIIKCRPPDNRNPEPDEIKACLPFLERQLNIIKPQVIVGLGKFASQTLLATDSAISRLRGHFHDYHGILFMPTYHPAFLLRNPARKKDVWNDMQKVMKKLKN